MRPALRVTLRFTAVTVLLLATLGAAAPARAAATCGPSGDTVRVMLQDLAVAPAWADRRAGFGQVVAQEAAKVPGFLVLSAEEVRSALNQEADKALAGCEENSCLAELAEALDAELVVSGRIDRAPDGGSLVSLAILNARAVVVVNRVVMSWRGADSELPEVLRAAAQTLLLEAKARPRGSIRVLGLPADARVFVDGEDRTVDHQANSIGGLEVGPHEIKVEASDMEPRVGWVVVKAGAQSAVTLTLEPTAFPAAVLWVGGVAAVVLGGAATLGIVYALGQSDVAVSAQVPAVGVNDGASKGAGAR